MNTIELEIVAMGIIEVSEKSTNSSGFVSLHAAELEVVPTFLAALAVDQNIVHNTNDPDSG